MGHEVTIPKLGLTMVDCTLTGWTKAEGERVEKGEVLFEIETDKITSEVEADAGGYLRQFAEVDTQHVVGAVIGGLYETKEEALAAAGPGLDVVKETAPVVARDGQIVIRPMMMLSMTFDHRLIDGAVAGRFRAELRALLERPATMLAGLR